MTNAHAGSWWAGIGVVITGLLAVASVVRCATFFLFFPYESLFVPEFDSLRGVLVCSLVLSILTSIIAIVGTCIDGITFGTINKLKGIKALSIKFLVLTSKN